MRYAAVSVAMCFVACGTEPPPVHVAPTPPPTAGASASAADQDPVGVACREEVAGLEDWLRAVEAAGLPLTLSLLDDGGKLVQRRGPKIVEPAPLVHVTSSKTVLDGTPVEPSKELEEGLLELINLRKSMMPRSPFIQSPRCYVAVDADVPWSSVVGVAQHAAAAGVTRLTFVFADSSRLVPAPPPSSIDSDLTRLAKSGPAKGRQMIAELMAYVYQDCPEALKVIANMGVNEVADFKQVLLDELPPALGECRCAPDVAAVKALHWKLFGNPLPTSGLTVGLAPPEGPTPERVELAADLSWGDAHAALVEHGTQGSGAIRLAVAADDEQKEGKSKRAAPTPKR